MSSVSAVAEVLDGEVDRGANLGARLAGLLPVMVAGAGLWFLYAPSLWTLGHEWRVDSLRSIGVFVPPVALWLCIRAWRSGAALEVEGSWWGLVPLVMAGIGGWALRGPLPVWVIGGRNLMALPIGGLIYLYVSGVVLLFAGLPAWRRSAFAIALLLLVNPIPGFFPYLVDLPLQAIGAETARVVAKLLDIPLDGQALQLMFTPRLGMFIAPGCNGLRGSVTMGLIALVLGHLHRMTFVRHALYVLVAVLLGYLFNLVRLCVLTCAYGLALHSDWLARNMEGVDYAIGAVLFGGAALYLFVAKRLENPQGGSPVAPSRAATTREIPFDRWQPDWAGKLLVLAAVVLPVGLTLHLAFDRPAPDMAQFPDFPMKIGEFGRDREWSESVSSQIIESQAAYSSGNASVRVGAFAGAGGSHNALGCYYSRGEVRRWLGTHRFAAPTQPVTMEVAVIEHVARDQPRWQVIGTTECTSARCEQSGQLAPKHFGLPSFALLFDRKATHQTVPLTVSLSDSAFARDGSNVERMIESFKQLMAGFDLSAIRAYAAAQEGR